MERLSGLLPLALLLVWGCTPSPSLKRLVCSGPGRQEVVFDARSGRLYAFIEPLNAYRPTPELRFSVQTTSSLRGDELRIETRVGEFSREGDASSWQAVDPPVGSDETFNLKSLRSQLRMVSDRPVRPVDKEGRCELAPLQT
ncbi:MAG: hypothetical protein ACO3L0_06420 [Vulcanococcus sp.]